MSRRMAPCVLVLGVKLLSSSRSAVLPSGPAGARSHLMGFVSRQSLSAFGLWF